MPIAVPAVVPVCVGMMKAMLDAVDDRTRAQEEQRFEEGMGKQVEKAGDVGASAQGRHHIAQLGNRRVGQDPFDVPLRYGDQRGKERREGADASHKLHAGGCYLAGCVEDRKHPYQQKDPC